MGNNLSVYLKGNEKEPLPTVCSKGLRKAELP